MTDLAHRLLEWVAQSNYYPTRKQITVNGPLSRFVCWDMLRGVGL